MHAMKLNGKMLNSKMLNSEYKRALKIPFFLPLPITWKGTFGLIEIQTEYSGYEHRVFKSWETW